MRVCFMGLLLPLWPSFAHAQASCRTYSTTSSIPEGPPFETGAWVLGGTTGNPRTDPKYLDSQVR